MDPVMYRTDDGNFVRFVYETERNESATLREGRPIFDKVLKVYIVSAGADKQEAVHEVEREFSDCSLRVRQHIVQRFAQQLQAFRAQQTSPELNGTPLEAWPALDVRQIAEFKALNLFTVEQLADVPDTGLQRLGLGARALQQRARAFLEAAKGNAPMEQLAAENEALKERLAQMEAQVAALAEAAEKKPRRAGPAE